MSKHKNAKSGESGVSANHEQIELRNITKTFPGGIVANDEVSLTLRRGSVHALLGENGAGKSTLMKIMYGLYTPDSGEIRVNQEPVNLTGPSDAKRLGIGMVHQHFQLIERLSVAENVLLSIPDRFRDSIADLSAAEAQLAELIDQYGFSVTPTDTVGELDVGQQQEVEILKSLSSRSDYLVLDEPTAALSPSGIDELLSTLRELAAKGYGILIVTHKLEEATSVADRITVLRDGQRIDTVGVEETAVDELAEKMVGRSLRTDDSRAETSSSSGSDATEPVLRVADVCLQSASRSCGLDNVNVAVYPGEIVGLAGISGNGRTELVDCLTGIKKPDTGLIELDNQDVTDLHPGARVDNGMSYIPEDRVARGCAPELSVKMNIGKKYYKLLSKRGILNWTKLTERARDIVSRFDVRTGGVDTKAENLSGGNMQKMIVGRELDCNPDLIVANNPTRGVDISAEEFVQRKLVEMRQNGVGVLFVSDDVDEILQMSDRVLTMYDGEITHRTDTQSADIDTISDCMTGNAS